MVINISIHDSVKKNINAFELIIYVKKYVSVIKNAFTSNGWLLCLLGCFMYNIEIAIIFVILGK